MDIPPYSTSGAPTREYYALVRAVELAQSAPAADQHVFAAVDVVRRRLAQGAPSSVCAHAVTTYVHWALNVGVQKQCRDALVLLLYCASAVSPGAVTHLDVDFAFSHAVNLAEAGRTIHERRIGMYVRSS
jgi:AP-4 complex subunit epsilon-1